MERRRQRVLREIRQIAQTRPYFGERAPVGGRWSDRNILDPAPTRATFREWGLGDIWYEVMDSLRNIPYYDTVFFTQYGTGSNPFRGHPFGRLTLTTWSENWGNNLYKRIKAWLRRARRRLLAREQAFNETVAGFAQLLRPSSLHMRVRDAWR